MTPPADAAALRIAAHDNSGAAGKSRPMRIMLLARSLEYGGAERQMVLLACGLHERGNSVGVTTFYPGGPLQADLEQRGVPTHCLEKRGRWDSLGFLVRFGRHLRRSRPEVVYGFLGTPNLFGLLAKPVCAAKVVWGVRASNLDMTERDWAAGAVHRAMRAASRFADSIVCNSHAGFEFSASEGFDRRKMTVIPNGIDTERFRPDPAARDRVRAELGIADQETLIGLVGRSDPMKDHATFLRAASRVAEVRADVRFVSIGPGPWNFERDLQNLAIDLLFASRLFWTGPRDDMPAVHNALDMLVSSSAYGEGFGNVLGEAMATGTPCVVTDVGDSAWIVGKIGEVAPPRDPEALAAGMVRTAERIAAGSVDRGALRARIEDEFSREAMVERTERHLRAVLDGREPR